MIYLHFSGFCLRVGVRSNAAITYVASFSESMMNSRPSEGRVRPQTHCCRMRPELDFIVTRLEHTRRWRQKPVILTSILSHTSPSYRQHCSPSWVKSL